MKKIIIAILICISFAASAQKKDSVIQITITRQQMQDLLTTIDANIDSKKVSKGENAVLQTRLLVAEQLIKELQNKLAAD